jgi:hypothetical protein
MSPSRSTGKNPKSVRFASDPPKVYNIPPTMGTWACERPYACPSEEAYQWSSRQMHAAEEGKVRRYEADIDLPALQERQDDDWEGRHQDEDTRYSTHLGISPKTFCKHGF